MPTTQVSAASSPPRHGGFLSAFRLTACGRLSAQKGVEPFTAQTDGCFIWDRPGRQAAASAARLFVFGQSIHGRA